MRRRTFLALLWLVLAVAEAGFAANDLLAGESSGYGYGLLAVGWAGLAGYYWLGTAPIDDPDEPAPRHWYELAAVLVVSLAVVVGLLLVAMAGG